MRKLIIFVLILTVIGLAQTTLSVSSNTKSNNITQQMYKTITVEENDTLWDIAGKFKTKDKDIRNKIHEIKSLNGLEKGVIHPGQELIIPVQYPTALLHSKENVAKSTENYKAQEIE